MAIIDNKCLYNLWFHSYEEDDNSKSFYRPSSYDFPLSRGRDSFEITKNGDFISYTIGPVDRYQKKIYKFEVKDENKLYIYRDKLSMYIIDILSCEKDLLIIKKYSEFKIRLILISKKIL